MLAHPLATTHIYALARIDASGRITNHTTTRALDWHPGTPLHAAVDDHGVITLHRSTRGNTALSPRRQPVIPAVVRHRCAISTGDQLLLVALPRDGVLLIHTLSQLGTLITAGHNHETAP